VKHPDLIAKWREIGLIQVFVGFEAIDSRILDEMNKRNTVENNDNRHWAYATAAFALAAGVLAVVAAAS
jgi:radical SAM superfamily enzyme YgiQ (UPF0313 family)